MHGDDFVGVGVGGKPGSSRYVTVDCVIARQRQILDPPFAG